MKHFRKSDNTVWAFEDDGSQDYLITTDMVPMSDAELIKWQSPKLTPAQLTKTRADAKDTMDIDAAKAHVKLVALRNMSPSEVQTWVTTNVTNFAQAQDVIATLAIAVSVLSRRM